MTCHEQFSDEFERLVSKTKAISDVLSDKVYDIKSVLDCLTDLCNKNVQECLYSDEYIVDHLKEIVEEASRFTGEACIQAEALKTAYYGVVTQMINKTATGGMDEV